MIQTSGLGWRIAGLIGLAICLASPAAMAQPAPADPDWPCVQRLMPEISGGMIWPGPPLDQAGPVADPQAVEAEAEELAARRVPLEAAQERVAVFAKGLSQEQRDAQLMALFQETLQVINRERASIIEGIKKFSRNQRALADKIVATNEKIETLPQDDVLQQDTLAAERDWDVRIFDDRRNSLTYLCDQPVLLEQRAFALARTISAQLE